VNAATKISRPASRRVIRRLPVRVEADPER
jgi:hypothetical protein